MRIAAAQIHPVWGDKGATTDRIVEWPGSAAADGVELVAFGETLLAGYPFWVSLTDGARFDDAGQKRAFGAASLVTADIDLTRDREERRNFDRTGHYSRPDVFAVNVDRRRRIAAMFRDDG